MWWKKIFDLNKLGSFASLISLPLALFAVFIADQQNLAIMSLLITESIIVLIAVYYFNANKSRQYPYDHEKIYTHILYDFENENKMTTMNEKIEALKMRIYILSLI